ncbi:MAG: aminotransferase class I/II-fold pyridoxal phosphate-dependent enzyme, partial [Patescibacteria group bacterium]
IPRGAFYTFSNITAVIDESYKFAYDLLKKEKVAVVPGKEFGSAGEGYIRCSYATAYEKIELAMEKLERYVRKHKR